MTTGTVRLRAAPAARAHATRATHCPPSCSRCSPTCSSSFRSRRKPGRAPDRVLRRVLGHERRLLPVRRGSGHRANDAPWGCTSDSSGRRRRPACRTRAVCALDVRDAACGARRGRGGSRPGTARLQRGRLGADRSSGPPLGTVSMRPLARRCARLPDVSEGCPIASLLYLESSLATRAGSGSAPTPCRGSSERSHRSCPPAPGGAALGRSAWGPVPVGRRRHPARMDRRLRRALAIWACRRDEGGGTTVSRAPPSAARPGGGRRRPRASSRPPHG